MIRSVSVKNFKGLKSVSLKNASRINLLGGKNNAGKTSILEALFLYHDRLNPNMLLRQYNWRGIDNIDFSPGSIFGPIFFDYNLNNRIEIQVTDHKEFQHKMLIKHEDNVGNIINSNIKDGQINTADERVAPNEALDIRYSGGNEREQHVRLVLNNNGITLNVITAKNFGITCSFLAAKAHSNTNETAIKFGKMDREGKSEELIDYLKIIEPRLKSLSTITLNPNNSMVFGDIGFGKKVPISYMGDGTSRLLNILLSIATNRNGIVFIDEIENGIHYSVMSTIWKAISKASLDYNCQIFATTHSYECLSAAINGLDVDVQSHFKYFRIEHSPKNDEITQKTFDFETLRAAIVNGWEVR
ncbi:AAA family ATPase [Sporolactobacillus sp. STCC-11]|uniref:AAA family ATPase n=1 Tax=Sporolactobacillus caesalpiniae TaxID=3230362 RepID=UPI0033931EBF